MPGDPVGIYGLAGAPPDAVSALDSIEASALRRLTERRKGELLVHERGQRYQASWPGDIGHDEPIEIVIHCPSVKLAQRPEVVPVGRCIAARFALRCRLKTTTGG